jgi:hypothetical protein
MKFINIAIIANIASASATESGLRDSQPPAASVASCTPGLPVPVPGIKSLGDACTLGCECFSAKCEQVSYNPLDGRTCQETVAVGEACNENNDCLSNNCPWAWSMTCALKANGEPCGWEGTLGINPLALGPELSALCESGRCEFSSVTDLFGTCAAKLADGETCVRAEDCESGSCNGWFSRTCEASALLEETNTLSLV